MRKALPVLFAAAAALSAAASAEVPAEVRARAAAVFAALDRIEAERARPARPDAPAPRPGSRPAPGSRRLEFGEAELNAYLACRADEEMAPYVGSVEVRLVGGDRIEGRVAVDLGRPQASGAVPRKHDLLFAARFETRDGRIRLDLDKLFLGAQPVAPAFVDLLIAAVARLQGVEPASLSDWYDLPPGVLRLETRPGRVVVIY